jgi:hypothetical protein
MRTLLTFVMLLCLPSWLWAADYSGVVVDALTSEGIAGAEILDQTGQKVKTNAAGKFTLTTERSEVFVTMPGFQEQKVTLLPGNPNKISMNLKGVYKLAEVEVKAKPDAKKVVVSKQHIDHAEVKEVTTALFPDVAKVVQLLPGVTTDNDFSSLLYVRGGDPDEVVAVLDNMIVLNPYIWGGRVSIFNPNLVDEVDFSTGGFPAEWPQAMSAILNVKNKVGNTEKLKGFVDLSAASFDLFLDGPLFGNLGGEKDGSFLLGLRRTDYDLLEKIYVRDNNVLPYFYDGQAKVTLPLYSGVVTLNSIFSIEGMSFHITPETGYGSPNEGESDFHYIDQKVQTGLSYDCKLSDTVSVMTLAGLSYENGDFKMISDNPVNVTQNQTIWQIRNTWQWLAGEHNIVKAGFNYFPGSGHEDIDLTVKIPMASAVYYEDTIDESKNLDFYYLGGFVQDDIEVYRDFLYLNPGANLQYFESNKQWIVNPRLAFKVRATQDWDAYFATGLYSQYPLDAALVDEKTGNPNLKAEEAIHYILGTKLNLGPDLFVQLETYYKDYRKMIVSDPVLNYNNNGFGHAYGFDVILQKKLGGKWDGWLTYSYVRSERKISARDVDPTKPLPTTPVDTWYLADSDRPHTLNLILNYSFNPKWKLSLTQKYCSGKLDTPIVGANTVAIWDAQKNKMVTEYIPIEGGYNSERMPAYMTTDIKLSMPVGNWKGWTAYCQVCNLFNVKNVDSYQYTTDYTSRREIDQLPFMLIGGIRWDF